MLDIILPSIGRPTLLPTVNSIIPQLSENDTLIIVFDGPEAKEAAPKLPYHPRVVVETREEKGGHNGSWARDTGMSLAYGTHLMFCDDDDTYTPDALETVRTAIKQRPDDAHVFQMKYANGLVLWKYPLVKVCNVGTPMFVVPNRADLPPWSDFDSQDGVHDFCWIAAVEALAGPPVFVKNVIAHIRH